MTWAQLYRQKWIADMLHVYGFINRDHLCRMFQISIPQASADLATFKSLNPDAMQYDAKRKTYLRLSARGDAIHEAARDLSQ